MKYKIHQTLGGNGENNLLTCVKFPYLVDDGEN